jgi:hypothetical protein
VYAKHKREWSPRVKGPQPLKNMHQIHTCFNKIELSAQKLLIILHLIVNKIKGTYVCDLLMARCQWTLIIHSISSLAPKIYNIDYDWILKTFADVWKFELCTYKQQQKQHQIRHIYLLVLCDLSTTTIMWIWSTGTKYLHLKSNSYHNCNAILSLDANGDKIFNIDLL